MTPAKGRELFAEAELPDTVVEYDPVLHFEEMRYLATGLIGALISLSSIESISGPELGSRIPLVVLGIQGDWLRIFVDPKVRKKKGGHRDVTAYSLSNKRIRFYTRDHMFAPWRRIVEELDRHVELIEACKQ